MYNPNALTIIDVKDDVTYWSYSEKVDFSQLLKDDFISDAQDRGFEIDDVISFGKIITNIVAFSESGGAILKVKAGRLPSLPTGFAYLIDDDGNFLVDDEGNYMFGEV
jgi:hypothetical protein